MKFSAGSFRSSHVALIPSLRKVSSDCLYHAVASLRVKSIQLTLPYQIEVTAGELSGWVRKYPEALRVFHSGSVVRTAGSIMFTRLNPSASSHEFINCGEAKLTGSQVNIWRWFM